MKPAKAQQIFGQLKNPHLRYGEGMRFDLKDFLFEDYFTALLKGEDNVVVSGVEGVKLGVGESVCTGDGVVDKIVAGHFAVGGKVRRIEITGRVDDVIEISSESADVGVETIKIIARKGSVARIIDRQTSSVGARYKSRVICVEVEEGAQLDIVSVQMSGKGVMIFERRICRVGARGKLVWRDRVEGGKFVSLHMQTFLCGEAEMRIETVHVAKGDQLYDLKMDCSHQGAGSKSLLLARGVVFDSAKSVYRGTIHIGAGVSGCIGHQRSDVLLVGDRSRADSVPVLDVRNDDVECSHGSTISKIDEEQLFYLQSRGVSLDEAQRVVVEGFVGERE